MNTNSFARLVIVCALGLAAVHGAEAKGSLSVGATIVSSCVVSSANVYRAVAQNAPMGSNVATMAGCTSDMAYSVSLGRQATSSREQADSGDVVVTLTY